MSRARSTCAYCGVGCGVVVDEAGGAVTVSGDPAHPANAGRLCSKGVQLGETLDTRDRPKQPLIDGRPAPWDTALARVADTFAETVALHGPDSVAIYASGQLLTEDYYVANKLMKGAIGSA
ncbi:MAG: molybdopterin-dependent oxidoreductase, partial [Pseudomonadota bacterium]